MVSLTTSQIIDYSAVTWCDRSDRHWHHIANTRPFRRRIFAETKQMKRYSSTILVDRLLGCFALLLLLIAAVSYCWVIEAVYHHLADHIKTSLWQADSLLAAD